MKKSNKTIDKELLGVDAALRRVALKAKQEAEHLGTPYVVYRDSSNENF